MRWPAPAASARIFLADIQRAPTASRPYQHLLNQRVERARTLLPDQTWTLAEVALRSGFSRQEHLSWMFRRFTGVVPGRYRRASN